VTHAQTWASYSALYRFGRLPRECPVSYKVPLSGSHYCYVLAGIIQPVSRVMVIVIWVVGCITMTLYGQLAAKCYCYIANWPFDVVIMQPAGHLMFVIIWSITFRSYSAE